MAELLNARVKAGKVRVTGSITIPTGLDSVDVAVATISGSAAPGLDPALATVTISSGNISIYLWKFTSSSNPTLVASTTASDVEWMAFKYEAR